MEILWDSTNSVSSRIKQPTEQEIGYVIIPEAFDQIKKIFDETDCKPDTSYCNNERAELSLLGRLDYQSLSFRASIKPRCFSQNLPGLNESFIGVIHTIQVPIQIRGRGIALRIVNTWEEILFNEGIRLFTAENVSLGKARLFWEHRGYKTAQIEVWKKQPYRMYKFIEG